VLAQKKAVESAKQAKLDKANESKNEEIRLKKEKEERDHMSSADVVLDSISSRLAEKQLAL